MRPNLGPLAVTAVLAATLVEGCSPGVDTSPERSRAPIAYVGEDHQVYTVRPDGTEARRVSPSRDGAWAYRWPTWSSDGSRLAFMGHLVRDSSVERMAIVVDEGGSARSVYESDSQLPIYMYWRPRSREIALLVQTARTLELLLIDTAPAGGTQFITSGQPLYWSWKPDGSALAIHVNGDVRETPNARTYVVGFESGGRREEHFGAPAADFRAPAWSHDGSRLAFSGFTGEAEIARGQASLMVWDGSSARALAPVGREPAFAWSPTSLRLALSSRSEAGRGLYDGIQVLAVDGQAPTRVTDDRVVAFGWSPDGEKLAYAAPNPNRSAFQWHTVRHDGGGKRDLAEFVPGDDLAFQFSFFDQYAQSASLWSPDSRSLVYVADSAPERSNGTPGGERIYVLDVDGASAPRALGRGRIATWAPR